MSDRCPFCGFQEDDHHWKCPELQRDDVLELRTSVPAQEMADSTGKTQHMNIDGKRIDVEPAQKKQKVKE